MCILFSLYISPMQVGRHSKKTHITLNNSIFTALQRGCRKVMFQSSVSVSLSVHMGSQVTITHDALDLTVQGTSWPWSPRHGTSLYTERLQAPVPPDIGPHCTETPWSWSTGPRPQACSNLLNLDIIVQGPSVSDIWWPRLEICSNLFTCGLL